MPAASVIEAPTVNVAHAHIVEHCCEALLDGQAACTDPAKVIVRFASHGCPRDGKGVLLCAGCRDWIAAGGVGCGACSGEPPEAELFIVSSVALTGGQ